MKLFCLIAVLCALVHYEGRCGHFDWMMLPLMASEYK